MDHKPLLQERPPAYTPASQGGDYGQSNYGAIPPPQPGFQPPPPYPYPSAAAATAAPAGYAAPPPQHNYPNMYTIIQQPATTTSVVVVGGCPACRSCLWAPIAIVHQCFTNIIKLILTNHCEVWNYHYLNLWPGN
ncbi:membrane protein BRI3 isoform 2-T2 [Pangshura tecta]